MELEWFLSSHSHVSKLIGQGAYLWCLPRRAMLLSIDGCLLLLRVARTAAVVCFGPIVGGLLLLSCKLLFGSQTRREQLALGLGLLLLLLLLWCAYTITPLKTYNSLSCSIVCLSLTGCVLTPFCSCVRRWR